MRVVADEVEKSPETEDAVPVSVKLASNATLPLQSPHVESQAPDGLVNEQSPPLQSPQPEPVASADAASVNALPGHRETLDEGAVTAGSFEETQVSSVDSQLIAAGYITAADVHTASDDKNRASLLQQPPSVIAAPVEVAVAETVGATEPGQDETIGYLLSLGQESIVDYRLLTPEDDNAYGYFRAVLRLDPANEDAHAGIQEIVDLYVIISRKAVYRGDNDRAGRYIDRGLSIQPGNRELLALKIWY